MWAGYLLRGSQSRHARQVPVIAVPHAHEARDLSSAVQVVPCGVAGLPEIWPAHCKLQQSMNTVVSQTDNY